MDNSYVLFYLFFIFFFGLLGTGIAEMVMQARWTPYYFLRGLNVYQKKSLFSSELPGSIDLEKLAEEVGGGFLPRFVFKELSPGVYGFREKIFQFCWFTYTPVMHGVIYLNRQDRSISVVGRANWYMLVFIVGWYANILTWSFEIPDKGSMIPFAVSLPVLLGSIYLIQLYRFKKIFKVVAEAGIDRGE